MLRPRSWIRSSKLGSKKPRANKWVWKSMASTSLRGEAMSSNRVSRCHQGIIVVIDYSRFQREDHPGYWGPTPQARSEPQKDIPPARIDNRWPESHADVPDSFCSVSGYVSYRPGSVDLRYSGHQVKCDRGSDPPSVALTSGARSEIQSSLALRSDVCGSV